MLRRLGVLIGSLLLAFAASSCAVPSDDLVAQGPNDAGVYRPAQPAARAGLPPAYRPFYDELESYGDWVLIEPYGWVFRPSVNFVAWRPYQEGWWEPSDAYGWVWNSTEPFGWITYHYGSWFYDNFQGWVWQPAGLWGPSWVAWVSVGDLVGWAPLAPSGYDRYDRVPGGAFTFVPARALTNSNAGSQAGFITNIAQAKGDAAAIFNPGHAGGTYFNRGPDAGMLSRLGAPMPAIREEVDTPRVRLIGDVRPHTVQELRDRTNRAVGEMTRELDALRGGGPSPLQPVNSPPPVYQRKPGTPLPKPLAKPLGRDSTRTNKRGGAPRPLREPVSEPADSTHH